MEIRNICVLPSNVFCNLGSTIILLENTRVNCGQILRSSTFPHKPCFQVQRSVEQDSPDHTDSQYIALENQYFPFRIGSEPFLVRNGSLQYFHSINGIVESAFHECDSVADVWRGQSLFTIKGSLISPQITNDELSFPETQVIDEDEIFDLWVLSDNLVATFDGALTTRIWRWNQSAQRFDLEKEFSATKGFVQSVSLLEDIVYLFCRDGRHSLVYKLPLTNEPASILIEDTSVMLMSIWKEHICTLHKSLDSEQITIKLWDTEGSCNVSTTMPRSSNENQFIQMKPVGDHLLVSANGVTYAFECQSFLVFELF